MLFRHWCISHNGIPATLNNKLQGGKLLQITDVCRRWLWKHPCKIMEILINKRRIFEKSWKHCGKRRNCLLWAISHFAISFLKLLFCRYIKSFPPADAFWQNSSRQLSKTLRPKVKLLMMSNEQFHLWPQCFQLYFTIKLI